MVVPPEALNRREQALEDAGGVDRLAQDCQTDRPNPRSRSAGNFSTNQKLQWSHRLWQEPA